MSNRFVLWYAAISQSPTPSPTAPEINPVNVTPGPLGFFVTVLLMLAVGMLAMSLMRRSTRATARFEIREELEREAAADAQPRVADRPQEPKERDDHIGS